MPTKSTTEDALKRSLNLLGIRAHSEEEIRVKLAQLGFPEKNIKSTLDRLRLLNLLNDEDFARSWALARVEGRSYGPLRIERELQQKGISRSLIRPILEEAFAEQGEKVRAKRLLEKRFRNKDLGHRTILPRAVALLQRQGYRNSVIGELLGQSLEDE